MGTEDSIIVYSASPPPPPPQTCLPSRTKLKTDTMQTGFHLEKMFEGGYLEIAQHEAPC